MYKVLVVDDHKINRDLISFMLKKMAINHDFAGDGFEALEALNEVRYDLVLMDIFMPNMGGIECLNMILSHDNEEIAKTRVIAVTAKPDVKGLDKFSGIISKPLDMNSFQNSLVEFLSNKPTG